ncbi:MAG: SUMF1/EgtB/PvdO family nonheme iron enzyme [Chloroflexota bacterium]
MTIDRAKLRQFFQNYVSDQELNDLCFDYFPIAYQDFSTGMTKSQKVRLLLDYALRQGMEAHLLDTARKVNAYRFAEMFGERAPSAKPNPATRVQRNPRQIFISHAHQDADLAQRLASDLEAEGWAVWIAPDSIQPGEQWVNAINRGLDESHYFLLLLTPDAVASRWVQKETNVAIELEHDGEMEILPLQIKPCRLPPLWRSYQRIPRRRSFDHGLQILLTRLRSRGIPTSPEPVGEQEPAKGKQEGGEKRPFLTFAREVYRNYIDGKTGLEMIHIPAGEFLYGKNKETRKLPDYWISKTPVTHAHYKRFLDANRQHPVPFVNKDWAQPYNWSNKTRAFPTHRAEHPVVLVSWHDAVAYAEWADMSLPTEVEWEKSARGTDGQVYPWGNRWENGRCNTSEASQKSTTPVGSYSPQGDSPFGCVDMSGNVWEWCLNRWSNLNDTTIDKSQDPRTLRGGSWASFQRSARATYRSSFRPAYRGTSAAFSRSGFRLVVHRPPSHEH